MERQSWRWSPVEDNMQEQLGEIRQCIDEIDTQITVLLNQRMQMAKRVGELKALSGSPIQDAGREQQVIARATEKAPDPLSAAAIAEIYRTLLEQSRTIQAQVISDIAGQKNDDTSSESVELKSKTSYFPRVAIIGVGLIGGAIARQIKLRMPNTTIIGCDAPDVLEKALATDIIHEAYNQVEDAVQKASLILLCAPPQHNLKLLKQVAPVVKRRQVIMDVTSTKRAICELAEDLSLKADFIGGHPLFGSDKQGIANAHSVSMVGKTFCLVPTKHSSEIMQRRLIRWLQELGMGVEVRDVDTHDDTVATTSHLVQLIATSLGSMITNGTSEETLRAKVSLSGPALQNISRLMNSPAPLWLDIVRQNNKSVSKALGRFIDELKDTKELIDAGQESSLSTKFANAHRVSDLLKQQIEDNGKRSN